MPEADTSLSFLAPLDLPAIRLDQWLSDCIPEWSRTRIQALIHDGQVVSQGRSDWRSRDRVIAGNEYTIKLPAPVPVAICPEAIPIDIRYEDHDLIVVDKPPGLVVHPAPGHDSGTLVNALLYHCKDIEGIGGEVRPGIVHRLDQDTSGIMVVAKTQQAMDSLAAQFQSREVRKAYVALVAGRPHPPAGRIETLIGRSPRDRKKMAVTTVHGKRAVTHYKVTETLGAFSLLRVQIETGRTHQIRVHMASVGCPIMGDAIYAGHRKRQWHSIESCKRQMLHAESLSFRHPESGEPLTFTSPLPADMQAVINDLHQDRRH